MSEENVEIVRRWFATFVRGALRPRRRPRVRQGSVRGPRGLPHEPEESIDAGGDRVLVFSREGGRGRESGAEVLTHPTAHLWTIRDGKAVRMHSYWERTDALEAAGLA